jgi:hypothetical protein
MATNPPADLVAAIQGYTKDVRIQEALLFGSYAESSWNVDSTGTGGGGFFGFTGTEWPEGIYDAPAATQVATIGPSYLEAVAGIGVPGAREREANPSGQAGVPANLTGAARTEYITIAAEGDYGDTTDLNYIAVNNTPSPTYNDFYNGTDYLPPDQVEGIYEQITQSLGTTSPATPQNPANPTSPSPYYISQSQTPTGYANATPAPGKEANTNTPRGAVYIFNQYMNPKLKQSGTDSQGQKQSFWGGVEDMLTGQTELKILGSAASHLPGGKAIETVITDAEIVSSPNNWILVIRQWITRLAVFAVGLIVLAIGVNMLTKGGLVNALKMGGEAAVV